MENRKFLRERSSFFVTTFLTFILLVLFLWSCVPHHDGPYKGRVVDLETGEPIEGAVIAAEWMVEAFVHSERICDMKESVSNKDGEFEVPVGRCTSHPFAEMYKPWVVIFKPGYLGYPPLGNTPEERKAHMPDFTGKEFRDKRQYYIVRLGKSKSLQERKFTLTDAESFFIHDEALKKLPALLKLTNQESKYLGLGERPEKSGGNR